MTGLRLRRLPDARQRELQAIQERLDEKGAESFDEEAVALARRALALVRAKHGIAPGES